MPPLERSLSVHGGVLHVCCWPPADRTDRAPLVLLHDSLGSVALWRTFPAQLAEVTAREVVAYDRMGFGRSTLRQDPPGSDFIEVEGRDVWPVLLDALGIERAVALGHSVGGAMALTAAALAPERSVAVISIAAQAFVEARTLDGIRAARARFADPGERQRLRPWHGDRADWVLAAWTEVWLSPDFADWTLDPWLPKVRCPVLAIHGDEDPYGSVAFPDRIVAGVAGPARARVLPATGHSPHRERADAVLAEIAGFLAPIP